IIAAMMFFFVIAIEIFDFVGLIGMPGGIHVLVLWIYDATHPVVGTPDCGAAIALYIRFLRQARRYAVLGGKNRSALPLALGRWKWLAVGYSGLWCAFAFLVPSICLIWVALVPFLQTFSVQALHTVNLNGFADGLAYIGEPLRNTVVLMTGAILLSIVWSVSISWMVTRGQNRALKWLDGLVFLAPAVPTMVSAI